MDAVSNVSHSSEPHCYSLSAVPLSATETKFLYPLLFAQSIVSNVLKIMVNFIFVKS